MRRVTQDNQGKKTAGVDGVKSVSPKLTRLIRGWLKAGVMEGLDFTPTEQGTPQGGVISPLLANVALHGMEEIIKEGFAKGGSVEKPILVRYADDFVIFHSEKAELQKVAERVTEWLKDMGLQLSPKKTRITHTLDSYEGNVGFDFLGYTVRQFRVGATHTGRNTHTRPLGFKTLIRPSKEAVKRHTWEIGRKLRELRNAPQEAVVSELNPIITGWCNYHGWVICSKVFHTCDRNMDRQLARWGYARHPGKTKAWTRKRYFKRTDTRIVFGTYITKEGAPALIYVKHHADTHSKDYVKVRGNASPYDGNLLYWTKRLTQHPLMKSEKAKLPTALGMALRKKMRCHCKNGELNVQQASNWRCAHDPPEHGCGIHDKSKAAPMVLRQHST
jgi:RNA-directed DNA polymerase